MPKWELVTPYRTEFQPGHMRQQRASFPRVSAGSDPYPAFHCIPGPTAYLIYLTYPCPPCPCHINQKKLLSTDYTMSTKHFFDDADKLVRDSLESLTFINPSLQYLASEKCNITSTHVPAHSMGC